MLMGTNTRAVDHDQIAIVGRRDRLKDAVSHAGLTPAHEAIVAGRGWATELGHIALGRAGAEAPENVVEHPSVIHPRHAARLVGQQRLSYSTREDCDPLEAVDLYTRQGSLNVSAKDLAVMGAPWLRAASIPSLESRSSAPMSVIMFWP
jgi:hypothetical protein